MFADAILTPVPDFKLATPAEVIAWGCCMSLAAVLFGWAMIVCVRKPRVGWLGGLLFSGSLAFLVGGVLFATQGRLREIQHNLERRREQQQHEVTP